mgnify:CR=1 FL=1
MPAAIRIKGMLKAVSVTLLEEVEDVAACFMMYIAIKWLCHTISLIGIINMIIVI